MQTKASQSDVSSTQKLSARMSANSRASRDFDEWCFRQIPELPLPARILDLGCGTGKQVLLFSPVFSPASEFWGIDLSGESLQTLQEQYSAPPQLHLIEGSFDRLEDFPELKPESFDLIYGAYALYYTKDLPGLIRQVYNLLKPGGIFWVIAPYTGTNTEFLRIIRPLHEVEDFMDYVFDRFHAEVVELGEKTGFSSIKPALLRNTIHFPTPKAFMDYLSNSLFYRPGHDDAIHREVEAVWEKEGTFDVSKRIISLQLRK